MVQQAAVNKSGSQPAKARGTEESLTKGRHGVVTRDKIKQILKFDKVLQKFCDKIGVDKATMMGVLVPDRSKTELTVESAFQSVNANSGARPQSTSKYSRRERDVDTGKAALLAYSNLDNQVEDANSQDWRRNTRNSSAKNLSGEKNGGTEQQPTAKFLDTSSSNKRPEIKDHIKSVKQAAHRQKSLVPTNQSNSSA